MSLSKKQDPGLIIRYFISESWMEVLETIELEHEINVRNFYTMNVRSIIKRVWLNTLFLFAKHSPWEDTARHYAHGAEYWRDRAKCAEALLTGQTNVRCKHRLFRDSLPELYRSIPELYCNMPPHTGGFHGAEGLRWDDTGKIIEGELLEEMISLESPV